jgi:chromosome partitioning protein
VAKSPAKPATIISVANQKGGVAKTTSVASLGAAFAELGKRVLLVDLDAQACLTFSLGVDPDEVTDSVNEVLLGKAAIADVRVSCEDGVDLVPSVIELAGADRTRGGGGAAAASAGARVHPARRARGGAR